MYTNITNTEKIFYIKIRNLKLTITRIIHKSSNPSIIFHNSKKTAPIWSIYIIFVTPLFALQELY
jgi:hypothetical protein